MVAKASDNNNLTNTFNRIVKYINSGFSVKKTGLNEDTLLKDCSLITNVIVLENDYVRTPFLLWEKFKGNDDLAESLKWINGYLGSDCSKDYLESCSEFTLNKGALITKILFIKEDFPQPLFFLTDMVKLIFRNVTWNIINNLNEHNLINTEEFFYRNYCEDKIIAIIQRWNPLVSNFETYIYNSITLKIKDLLKKIDPDTDPIMKELERDNHNSQINEDNCNMDLFYRIFHYLLLKLNIRPHKLLFFYTTNYVYSLNKNIDANGFYEDNFDKELKDLYNQIYDNSKFWDIRNLLERFYQKKLIQETSKIYNSKSEEDMNIRKLAGNILVGNIIIAVFFNDCITGGKTDLAKVGQRLASWNFHIKEKVSRFVGPA